MSGISFVGRTSTWGYLTRNEHTTLPFRAAGKYRGGEPHRDGRYNLRNFASQGADSQVPLLHWCSRRHSSCNASMPYIATTLNTEGITNEVSKPWTRGTIHELLTNEKYIGNNLYNRTSTKLQTPRTTNPQAEWVRQNGAFTP